jgi:hypothetical protein
MVKRFHHEECPLDGVVGLSQQGAGDRHLRVGEDGISPRFLLPKPAPDALAVGSPRRSGDVIDKVAEPLPQRKHPQVLAPPDAGPPGVELRAECLPHRRRDGHEFRRELEERVAETGAETISREERAQDLVVLSNPSGKTPRTR